MSTKTPRAAKILAVGWLVLFVQFFSAAMQANWSELPTTGSLIMFGATAWLTFTVSAWVAAYDAGRNSRD